MCSCVSADWKKEAYSNLVHWCKRRLYEHDPLLQMMNVLSTSYQFYPWYVCIPEKDSSNSFKCRLGGFGELVEWKNDPECTYNMYVYRVAKSKLEDRGGECTDEDEKKAKNIVEDVAESNTCRRNSNYSDRVAEEVESPLNRDSLHWLVIQVCDMVYGFAGSQWSDICNLGFANEWDDKYDIEVSLSYWLCTIHFLTLPLHLHLPSSCINISFLMHPIYSVCPYYIRYTYLFVLR